MPEDQTDKDQPNPEDKLVDLSQLEGLSFGTSWSEDKAAKSSGRGGGKRTGGPRPDRRGGAKRPGGGPGGGGGGDRGPRGRPGGGGRGPRRDQRDQGGRGRRDDYERPFQPTIDVAIYPGDEPFAVLTRRLRASGLTYELFDIAKLILEKPERFVVVLHPLKGGQGPDKFYITQADKIPFASEQEAVNHALSQNLDRFFDMEEIEVEPPKGNFQVVNRCGITGELLGPPNYHRYNHFLREHQAERLPNMSLNQIERRVESVSDEEVVNAWVEKMKKQTRFTLKSEFDPSAKKAAAPAKPEGEGGEAAEGDAEAKAEETPQKKGKTFETPEDARNFLLATQRDKLYFVSDNIRVSGNDVEKMPPASDIRKSIESTVERQRRFPMDTANHLRGRLRRMNFTIYKKNRKGTKGVSYISGVKRRFREPGQVFAGDIQELLDFIEAHPGVRAVDLPKEFLGVETPEKVAPESQTPAETVAKGDPQPKPAEEPKPELTEEEAKAKVKEAEEKTSGESQPAGEAEAKEAKPEAESAEATATDEGGEKAEETADKPQAAAETDKPPEPEAEKPKEPAAQPEQKADPAASTQGNLSEEDAEQVKKLRFNLRWLVMEGYVVQYYDGTLLANPVLQQGKSEDDDDSDDSKPYKAAGKSAAPKGEKAAKKEALKAETAKKQAVPPAGEAEGAKPRDMPVEAATGDEAQAATGAAEQPEQLGERESKLREEPPAATPEVGENKDAPDESEAKVEKPDEAEPAAAHQDKEAGYGAPSEQADAKPEATTPTQETAEAKPLADQQPPVEEKREDAASDASGTDSAKVEEENLASPAAEPQAEDPAAAPPEPEASDQEPGKVPPGETESAPADAPEENPAQEKIGDAEDKPAEDEAKSGR